MKNFRTLDLAVSFYKQATALPCDKHLRDQLHRAASSIVLNLAEGWGKTSPRDRCRFFDIAFGSLRECQALMLLLGIDGELADKLDKLAAHVYKLRMVQRR